MVATIRSIAKATLRRWWDADPASMGAAFAFYALLSIAPLSLFLIVFFGKIAGAEAVQSRLLYDISKVVGTQAADLVTNVIADANNASATIVASVVGFIIVLLGSLGMFDQIKISLDKLWGIEQSSGIQSYLRDKLASLITVVTLGALLVVSIGFRTIISLLINIFGASESITLATFIGNVLSSTIALLLIAAVYRYLPARWTTKEAALTGAAITVALFLLGRYAIGIYLAYAITISMYGAASAIIAILIWMYYVSQIFFLGAAWAIQMTEYMKGRTYTGNNDAAESSVPVS